MAVPPVLSDLVSAPNAPNGSGQGGRTAASKFYEISDNLRQPVLASSVRDRHPGIAVVATLATAYHGANARKTGRARQQAQVIDD